MKGEAFVCIIGCLLAARALYKPQERLIRWGKWLWGIRLDIEAHPSWGEFWQHRRDFHMPWLS